MSLFGEINHTLPGTTKYNITGCHKASKAALAKCLREIWSKQEITGYYLESQKLGVYLGVWFEPKESVITPKSDIHHEHQA